MRVTLKENGSTDWVTVKDNGAHVSLSGTFGGGTVTLEQDVSGSGNPVAADLLDGGTALTYTAADDVKLLLNRGDKIRATLAGATSPSLVTVISV